MQNLSKIFITFLDVEKQPVFKISNEIQTDTSQNDPSNSKKAKKTSKKKKRKLAAKTYNITVSLNFKPLLRFLIRRTLIILILKIPFKLKLQVNRNLSLIMSDRVKMSFLKGLVLLEIKRFLITL